MKQDNDFNLSRRSFLKITGGAAALASVSLPGTSFAATDQQVATLIDLSLCDGMHRPADSRLCQRLQGHQ